MRRRVIALLLFAGACSVMSACGHGESANDANVEAPPPVVIVGTVRQQTVPITEDYQGTIGAVESVEIRARVEGTLERAPFKEGSLVRAGQLIFQIQQNQYLAALRSAQAQLATAHAQVQQAQGNLVAAQATLTRATTTVERDRPLAADKAIPQKDLDNAIQSEAAAKGNLDVANGQIASAKAAVLSGEAAVSNAKINYGYTTIYAPVTGLIGFLTHDVGNVVGGSTTQVLDTMTSIDPVKVNFSVDEKTYLQLSDARRRSSVQSLRDQDLRIVLADNATYAYPGRLYTLNPTVDQKTGTIAVEARFPNPDGLLRPGGFARVRLVTEQRPNALLVPQTAVVLTQGTNTVYVVGKDDTVAVRTVSLGPQYKQDYIVQDGLAAGDRVIVEGTQKVQPGSKVIVKKSG